MPDYSQQILEALSSYYGVCKPSELLLIGSAPTGPVGYPVTVSSIDEASDIFGTDILKPVTLERGDTTVTLDYPARSIPTFRRILPGGKDIIEDIPDPSIDDEVVTLGTAFWRDTVDYRVEYQTTAVGTELVETLSAIDYTEDVTLVRFNGAHAYTLLGDLLLVDKDGGAGGNELSAAIYDIGIGYSIHRVLEISGPTWYLPQSTTVSLGIVDSYGLFTPVDETLSALAERLLWLSQQNILPVIPVIPDESHLLDVVDFTTESGSFANGSDGLLSDGTFDSTAWSNGVVAAIGSCELQDYVAIHIPICTDNSFADSDLNAVTTAVTTNLDTLSELSPPAIFFSIAGELSGADIADFPDSSSFIATIKSLLLSGCSDYLWCTTLNINRADNVCCGALAASAYLKTNGTRALTGLVAPGDVLDFEPTQAERGRFYLNGVQVLKTGRGGIVLEHDKTLLTVGDNTYPTQLYSLQTYQRILLGLKERLSPYLGGSFPDQSIVEDEVLSVIESFPQIDESSYTITFDEPEHTITIEISCLLFGEISITVLIKI